MLASELGRLSGAVVPPELQFLYRLIVEARREPKQVWSFSSVIPKLRTDYSFEYLEIDAREIGAAGQVFDNQRERTFPVFFSALMHCYAESKGLPGKDTTIIEHSPVSRRYVNSILEFFPEARFVGIYRDPRAVFASFKKVSWGPRSAGYFATWWKNAILETFAAKAMFPDAVELVSYESVLDNPDETLTHLLDVMGMSKDASFSRENVFSTTDYNRQQHSLVNAPIDSSRSVAWMSELKDSEVAIIEHHCSNAMSLLGYQLSGTGSYSRVRYAWELALEKPRQYYASRAQAVRRAQVTGS